VASVGEEEHFINHRLHADLHGLYPVLLEEEEENLFTEGVRAGRNADGINTPGSKERLNLLQIRDLIFRIHGRETSSVEGHLFFSVPVTRKDLLKRRVDEPAERGGIGASGSRRLLVAEEALPAAIGIRKEDGDDDGCRESVLKHGFQ